MRLIIFLAVALILRAQVTEVTQSCFKYQPGSSRCQICISGLQLDDVGNCKLYTPISGCNIYNSTSGVSCAICGQGYLKSRGICLQILDNCQSTTNVNTCDKCKQGFLLVRYSNCFSKDIQNCPQGSIPRTVDGQSFCQEYNNINCIQTASNGRSCQTCSDGLTLINGICFSVASQSACPGNSCLCQGYLFNDVCYGVQLSNCIQASNRIYCNLCDNGFYQSRGVCLKFIKNDDVNCNVLSADRTRCAGCNLGYFLNSNFICVKNFDLCMDGCDGCPYSGFQFFNNNCYYNDPFCVVYEFNQQICQLCLEGYSYSARLKRCDKERTCLRRNSMNFCVQCFLGYQINNITLACEELPSNCLVRGPSGVCSNCSQLTTNIDNICAFVTLNCQMYNSAGYCLNCTQGFVQVRRTCQPVARNCQVFAQDRSKCITCSQGYRVDNFICYLIVQGCMNYISQDRCGWCDTNYLLVNGSCFFRDVNCLGQNQQGVCISCRNGFLPYGSRCVYYDPYCVAYNRDGIYCSAALGSFSVGSMTLQQQLNYNNFVLQANSGGSSSGASGAAGGASSGSGGSSGSGSGFGSGGSSGSSSSSNSGGAGGAGGASGGSSSSSSSGGSFSSSSSSSGGSSGGGQGQGSFRNGQIISLPFAGIRSSSISSYSLNGNILRCRQGFTLFQSQCVTSTPNCASYNQYGTCQQCNPGFDMIANNRCVTRSATTCAQQAGGVCRQAASGYVLINGASFFAGGNAARVSADGRVLSANSGYFVWSQRNIAWPFDNNCRTQSQPNKCQACTSPALTLVNGRCVLQRLNCLAYSPLGLCQGCQAGFILWGGYCRPSNCNNIDPLSGFCLSCQTGFTLSLGMCVQSFVSNCQLYNQGRCSSCTIGFYLTNGGLCLKMIDNCQTASRQTGRCIQCIFSYTLYRQQCIKTIPQCRVYSTALNSCDTCNQLFYPVRKGSQCGSLGFYCAQLDDNLTCTKCNPGLTRIAQNNTFICVNPIIACLRYDQRINCRVCQVGFILQFNRCKSIRCAAFDFRNSTCTACLPPFILRNGFCQTPDCARPDRQLCLLCSPGFFLNGTICTRVPDAKCDQAQLVLGRYRCLKCAPNFILNQLGWCVSNQIIYNGCARRQFPCTRCQVGYVLNGSLCYARRCAGFKQNRDCQSCINYYVFEPTQRFCIIYTCQTPSCFQSDGPPPGFFFQIGIILRISFCVVYNGADCAQCQGFRYPNPAVKYRLCYPYNCAVNTLYNCSNNCIQNYAPTAQHSGTCLPRNCQSIDSTAKCLTCLPQFQLIDNAYCIRFFISNCRNIDFIRRVCLDCIPPFVPFQSICRAFNCRGFLTSNQSLCQVCDNGYQLTQNRTCKLAKCDQVSPTNSSQCLSCFIGYYLQGGICYARNCTAYDWNTMACVTCAPGFELVPTIGICRASNCQSYDSRLICRVCNNAPGQVYLLKPGGVCELVDPNCLQFNQLFNCISCRNPNLYIPLGTLCIVRVAGCAQYNAQGCISCLPAYDFEAGLCRVKNCQNFTTPATCARCRNRFTLNPNQLCLPLNCLNFNQAQWRCTQCEPRFELIQNQVCYTRNCSSPLLPTLVCSACLPGFTLVGQTCIYANCPDGNQLTCPVCLQGFQLWNGVCRVPPTSCRQFDNQLLNCRNCPPGFNRTALGTCLFVNRDEYCVSYDPQTNLCIRCLPNFNYNQASGQCQSAFCIRFNPQAQVISRRCVGCITGFVISQSGPFCIPSYCQTYLLATGICTSCSLGCALINNTCTPRNCQVFSRRYPIAPFCQRCRQGFQLNPNSLCIPSNCNRITAQLQCITCNQNFIISNGICVSTACPSGFIFQNFNCVPADCERYDPVTLRCLSCLQGFVFENNSCIADACIRFNQQYVCLQCRPGFRLSSINGRVLCLLNITQVCPSGFYLKDSQCIAIPVVNCSIYDPQTNRCWSCLPNFYLRDGICYLLDNCDRYSFINGCYSCIMGYRLTGFLCVFMNCNEIYPNNTCRNCLPSFTLTNGICRRDIYRCVRTDQSFNCVQCAPQFQLRSGFCIAIGCAAYDPMTYLCLNCFPGFSLSGQNCIQLPNCFRPANATFCQTCNNGFLSLRGWCWPQIQFCRDYNDRTGACTTCLQGYYLNSKAQCIRLSDFCLQANVDGRCLSCAVGYRQVNGICQINTRFCDAFSAQNGRCIRCFSGYYLNAQAQCILLPSDCLSANLQGHCLTCRDGFTLSRTICVRIIINCLIYNENNPAYCFQCLQAYYLNLQYRCSLLPPACLTATNLGSCLSCAPGFQSFNIANLVICVRPVANCAVYRQALPQAPQCSLCANGFTLTSQFTCSSLPRNCLQVNPLSQCVRCLDGFSLFQNICVRIIPLCSAYDPNTYQCSACSSGYYLAQSPIGLGCSLLPRFCLGANLLGFCTSCLPGYFVYNNLCVLQQSILNCQSYDLQKFLCLQCLPGFFLSSNNFCVRLPNNCANANPQGICIACARQFTLIGRNCVRTIQFCFNYEEDSGRCVACRDGYALSQDRMSCIRQVLNCRTLSPNGVCLQCLNGFFLINGFCFQLPPNCNQLNNNQICIACMQGFVLVDQVCIRTIQFCLQYNINGCSLCQQNYYLNASICNPFPQFCGSFDTNRLRCLACVQGYTLNPSTFVCFRSNMIANCASYNGLNQCISCFPRFFLRDNACFAYPQFCLNVDLLGNCLSCSFGSVWSNGRCIATQGRSLFCINYNTINQVCVACMRGYNFCSVAGVCLAIDSACRQFNSQGLCNQCSQSYTLYRGQCLVTPPGLMIAPNGGVNCRAGYYLKDNTCFKAQNTLTRISSQSSQYLFTYSSNGLNSSPFVGSNAFWSPSISRINQYISIQTISGQPQIIFKISIRGSQAGWVRGYIIQFKNRQDTPFICWNGCSQIIGSNDGNSISQLELYHPIVASEVRLYPVRWNNVISLQVDLWISNYQ